MTLRLRSAVLIVMVCGMTMLPGCSADSSGDKWKADRPKVVPAKGTVTFKGQPLGGATVVFAPAGEGKDATAASAVTDGSGWFSLSAFPPDAGAVPGNYKVYITKTEAPPQNAKPLSHEEDTGAPPKSVIPEKYGNPATSGLTAEIPEAGNSDLKFELTE